VQATRQQLGRGCGNALDCARDSVDGEPSARAMAAERETWDDLVAILPIQLASLLEPLFPEK
jgi:UTP-glucose-1-phosphate uridylyltransferase